MALSLSHIKPIQFFFWLAVLHDPKVVKKYAPDSIIGTLKE
jgi:hypothetical protein